MHAKKGGRTAFILTLDAAALRPRKASAPASRPHTDKRRKAPRRREDLLALRDE